MAARHLWHYGYQPTIYYPKRSKNELYEVSSLARISSQSTTTPLLRKGKCNLQRLATQLKNLDVPFTEDFESDLRNTHHVVDAIFGVFSFLHLSIRLRHMMLSNKFGEKASVSPAKCANPSHPSSLRSKRRPFRLLPSMHLHHGILNMGPPSPDQAHSSTRRL